MTMAENGAIWTDLNENERNNQPMALTAIPWGSDDSTRAEAVRRVVDRLNLLLLLLLLLFWVV